MLCLASRPNLWGSRTFSEYWFCACSCQGTTACTPQTEKAVTIKTGDDLSFIPFLLQVCLSEHDIYRVEFGSADYVGLTRVFACTVLQVDMLQDKSFPTMPRVPDTDPCKQLEKAVEMKTLAASLVWKSPERAV